MEAIYGHMFLLYYEMQKAEYKIVATHSPDIV